MLRNFARDSLIYGLANAGVRSLSILLIPLYTRFLSPDEYGVFDVLMILAGIATIVIPLEITQALARFFPADADEAGKREFATSALWFAALGYAVFVCLAIAFGNAVASVLFGSERYGGVAILAAVATMANGIFYVLQSLLRWSLLATKYAVASIAYGLTAAAVTLLLVVASAGPAAFFAGQIAGAIAGSLFAGVHVRSTIGGPVDRARLVEMLRFSIPFIPSSLSLVFSAYVDRLLLNMFATLTEVGIFGVGYRVASVVQLLVPGVQGAMTPLIYAMYKEPDTPREIARIFRLYAALSLVVWLGLGLFATTIVKIATAPEYHRAAIVVPLLVPAILLNASYVFMPGPAIAKRTAQIAAVNIAGAVMNTVLCIALIPPFGILGAAAATATTALVTFVIGAALSQRSYPVPHDWLRLGFVMAMSGLMIGVGWTFGSDGPGVSLASALVLFLVGTLFVVAVLTSPEERRNVLQVVGHRLRGVWNGFP